MRIPVKWLNESFRKDYSGEELSDLLTLSGIESEIEVHKNQKILDISLTPNRADCFSYKGVVQEISALDNTKTIPILHKKNNINHDEKIMVDVQAKDDCPVFITRVIKSIDNKINIIQYIGLNSFFFITPPCFFIFFKYINLLYYNPVLIITLPCFERGLLIYSHASRYSSI